MVRKREENRVKTWSDPIESEAFLMEAVGVGGTLQLYPNKIKIVRKGALAFSAHGLKGDKEIMTHQISSIQMKMPGFTNGYIQFAFWGGTENKGGIFDATQDENTVIFTESQTDCFIRIKKAIEDRIAPQHQPISAPISSADEIEKLANLRDRKAITEEEFQAAKKKIIG